MDTQEKDVLVGSIQKATDEAQEGLDRAKQKAFQKTRDAGNGLSRNKRRKRSRGNGCLFQQVKSRHLRYWHNDEVDGVISKKQNASSSLTIATATDARRILMSW